MTEPTAPVAEAGAATTDAGRVALAGDWTIESAGVLRDRLTRAMDAEPGDIVVDGSAITRFDTAGAWLVETARRRLDADGRKVALENFDADAASLIETVGRFGQDQTSAPARGNIAQRFIEAVGRQALDLVGDALAVLSLFGELCAAVVGLLTLRRKMRWASLFNHIDRMGLKAIPIVALMSFLIGMIIAQQGGFYLRTFGAEVYVIALVGVLVCREIGVLLTAIMVAGRTGSAITAEIGSMKMREEIDALTVLGVSPTDVLVMPRVLALVISLPLLTIVADLAALAGAWVIVVTYIGIPSNTFFQLLREAVTLQYVLIGLAKAPVMAATIGLMACVEGRKVSGSAESLGLHTTLSVVKGIFMVIVMDGFFAIMLASAGI
ncbi:ABC transporter permease [Methylobrevis albus]|uniref:ABC transporter permease n=1 Tax=Methylobrevis albus TaxID=2793297 RepID=A0A931I0N6_9HYPH|nr:ABC transporter permease [Methylobrevis albus]MBH0236826.1 ABC transporter permease [Methylobrevis albus]